MSKNTLQQRLNTKLGDTEEFVIESLVLNVVSELRRFMREEGLTQAEIAKTMGMSQAGIAKLLAYDRNMTLKSVARLARAMGARWEEFKLNNYSKDDFDYCTLNSFTGCATVSGMDDSATNRTPSLEETFTIFGHSDGGGVRIGTAA